MTFHRRAALAALVALPLGLGLGAPLAPAHAQTVGPQAAAETVSIALFYERLAPHGEWVEHPRWGWSWYPTKVDAGWRPYLHGRWIMTDEYGWYWQSDEDWGWATYHYGRWSYDARYGWLWVPGTVWGPGWVAWRQGNDTVGWAPLPPGVDYSDDGGLVWGDVDLADEPYAGYWVFVPGRLFLGLRLGRYALPMARNRAYLGTTRNATRFERRNGRVFNRGLEPADVARRFGRPVPRARVRQVTGPQAVRPNATGNTVNVFRPRVTRNAALRPPTRATRTPPRTLGQRQATPTRPTRPGTRTEPGDRTAPDTRTPPRTQPRTQPRTEPRATPRNGQRTEPRRQPPTRVEPGARPRPDATPRVQPRTAPQPGTEPRRRMEPRTQPRPEPRAQPPRVQPPRVQQPRVQQPRVQPPRVQQPRPQPRVQQPRPQPGAQPQPGRAAPPARKAPDQAPRRGPRDEKQGR